MNKESKSGSNLGWIREDGIVHIKCGEEMHANGIVYGQRDALDAKGLVADLSSDRDKIFVLCDIKNIKKTDAEARYVPPPEGTARIALLVESPVSRMIGNAYMGFRAPVCPTRLFTREQPAIRWLLSAMNSK